MNPIRSVLITGANAGLGRECARQLAEDQNITKVILACRNRDKAETAKAELQAETGRQIFETLLMDVMDLVSVRDAVAQLGDPVDAVILNAGGMGGTDPTGLTPRGVTNIFAVNVQGHVALVDHLLEQQLVTSTILYAGSEAARGIPKMGVAPPTVDMSSDTEISSVATGRGFAADADPLEIYGTVKLTAAMWMASMARQHPAIRFVTISPGGTTGTNGMDDLPFLKRLMFKHVGGVLMPLLGMMHDLETGARRYVEALSDPKFESGRFYASRAGSPTGPVVDQATIQPDFGNPVFQDNVNRAVHRFV